MHSAIRFSRSQSQSSRSTSHAAPSMPREVSPEVVDVNGGIDGYRELPSSIPSAPSHSVSQRTTATTTTTKSSSARRSQSTRSNAHEKQTPEVDAAGYAWANTYPLSAFSHTAAAASAAEIAGAEYAQHPEEKGRGRPRDTVDDKRRSRSEKDAQRIGEEAQRYSYPTFPFSVPNLPWIPPPPLPGASFPHFFGHPAFAGGYEGSLRDAHNHHHHRHHHTTHENACEKGRSATNTSTGKEKHDRRTNVQHPPFMPAAFPYAASGFYPGMPPASHLAASPDADWPSPDQLKLPSSFPMPPYALPQTFDAQDVRGGSDARLFPPPPLPPWWFLQAMQPPSAIGPKASISSCSSSSSSRSRSSSAFSASSESSASSRTSSSSSSFSTRDERGASNASHTPSKGRMPSSQHAKRFTAPAGSVQTPAPVSRANDRRPSLSSSSATAASRLAKDAMSYRGAAGVPERWNDKQNNNENVKRGSASLPARYNASPASQVASASMKKTGVTSARNTRTATDYHDAAQHIEQPVRHTTGLAFDSSRDAQEERIGTVREESADARRMHDVVSAAESYLQRMEDLYQHLRHRYEEVLLSPVKEVKAVADRFKAPRPFQRNEAGVEEEGEHDGGDEGAQQFAARTTTRAYCPSEQPTHPLRGAVTHAPSPVTREEFRSAVAMSSAVLPAASSPSPAQSLRQELALLESQWQRLEELKQHSVRDEAAFVSSFTAPSAPSLPSATAGAGVNVGYSVKGADVFSNQSVMELINDRKHLLAASA